MVARGQRFCRLGLIVGLTIKNGFRDLRARLIGDDPADAEKGPILGVHPLYLRPAARAELPEDAGAFVPADVPELGAILA